MSKLWMRRVGLSVSYHCQVVLDDCLHRPTKLLREPKTAQLVG